MGNIEITYVSSKIQLATNIANIISILAFLAIMLMIFYMVLLLFKKYPTRKIFYFFKYIIIFFCLLTSNAFLQNYLYNKTVTNSESPQEQQEQVLNTLFSANDEDLKKFTVKLNNNNIDVYAVKETLLNELISDNNVYIKIDDRKKYNYIRVNNNKITYKKDENIIKKILEVAGQENKTIQLDGSKLYTFKKTEFNFQGDF